MKTSTLVLIIAFALLVSSLFNVENFINKDSAADVSKVSNGVTGFSIADGSTSKIAVGIGLILAVALFGWFFIIKQTEVSA